MKEIDPPEPGTTFGRWTVLGPAEKIRGNKASLCRCSCGTIKAVMNYCLRNGSAVACGCRFLEHVGRIRKPVGEASRNAALNNIKQRARLRKHEMTLTDDQIFKLMDTPCYWCGRIGVNERRSRYTNGSYRYNGLDRLDNNQGYTVKNTVSCCGPCNRAKSTLTAEEFIELCHLVVKNNSFSGVKYAAVR